MFVAAFDLLVEFLAGVSDFLEQFFAHVDVVGLGAEVVFVEFLGVEIYFVIVELESVLVLVLGDLSVQGDVEVVPWVVSHVVTEGVVGDFVRKEQVQI